MTSTIELPSSQLSDGAEPRRAPRTPHTGSSRQREVISWLMTLLLAAALVGGIKLIGLSLVVVTTDSMEPTLMPRDFVLVVSPRLVRPEVGSVVVFTPTFAGTPLPAHIHRLVAMDADGSWQTRGDNANGKDPWRVRPDQVKAVSTGVRMPASITRSPWTIGLAAFFVALLALWPTPRSAEADRYESALPASTSKITRIGLPPTARNRAGAAGGSGAARIWSRASRSRQSV